MTLAREWDSEPSAAAEGGGAEATSDHIAHIPSSVPPSSGQQPTATKTIALHTLHSTMLQVSSAGLHFYLEHDKAQPHSFFFVAASATDSSSLTETHQSNTPTTPVSKLNFAAIVSDTRAKFLSECDLSLSSQRNSARNPIRHEISQRIAPVCRQIINVSFLIAHSCFECRSVLTSNCRVPTSCLQSKSPMLKLII